MKQILLTQGKFAIIDDEDFEFLNQWKWCFGNGYVIRRQWLKKEKSYIGIRMHRLITNCPSDKEIDHINGNKLDNRKENLRIVNRQQNSRNQKSRIGTSPYKGVHWAKHANKWRAEIKINGKTKVIGYFDIEYHAAFAYDLWADYLFGEFAKLNFQRPKQPVPLQTLF